MENPSELLQLISVRMDRNQV